MLLVLCKMCVQFSNVSILYAVQTASDQSASMNAKNYSAYFRALDIILVSGSLELCRLSI